MKFKKANCGKHTLTNEQLRMKRLSFTSTNRCVTAICLYLTSLQTFCSSTIGFKSLFKFSFNTEAKGRGAALTGYASPNTIYTFFPLSYQMPSDLRTASTFFSASASALV